jgi:hypothetical protein
MLSGLLMLFFSFNPIICGVLLTVGISISLRHSRPAGRALDLSGMAPQGRWRAGGLRHAGRQ